MSNLALRQHVVEATGRTWVYRDSRHPGLCATCERHVLLAFDADTNHVECPDCGWEGIPARLLGRMGVADDAGRSRHVLRPRPASGGSARSRVAWATGEPSDLGRQERPQWIASMG